MNQQPDETTDSSDAKTVQVLFADIGKGITDKRDIGGVFAVDVSRDLEYCGHVYSIMTLDEDNNIPQPIELEEIRRSVKETVILCDDGKYSRL